MWTIGILLIKAKQELEVEKELTNCLFQQLEILRGYFSIIVLFSCPLSVEGYSYSTSHWFYDSASSRIGGGMRLGIGKEDNLKMVWR